MKGPVFLDVGFLPWGQYPQPRPHRLMVEALLSAYMSTSGQQLVPNSGALCSLSLVFTSDGSKHCCFGRLSTAVGFSLKKLL